MAAPFALLPLTFPPDLVSVRLGDVDGDGRDEIVLVSSHPTPGGPDAVSLEVVYVSREGRIEARQQLQLGQRALLWDISDGIWLVDGEGLSRLGADGRQQRVASFPTPLAGLGPTTPRYVELAWDLDGDGRRELVVPGVGRLIVVSEEGEVIGELPAASHGRLARRVEEGAQALTVGVELARYTVGDTDGDGISELLVVQDGALVVHDSAGARRGVWRIPVPLDEDEAPEAEVNREVTEVDWLDIDGDGKLDLLVHRSVVGETWFGSTAEIVLCRGTGAGFAEPQVVATDTGSYATWPIDIDHDGDLDIVLPQIDLGFSSLARGLVSRSLQVPLVVYRVEDGRLSEVAEPIFEVRVDLEDPDLPWNLHGDFDGDRIPDLAMVEGDLLLILPGTGGGFGEPTLRSMRVHHSEELLVGDLTGDGRTELIAWSPRASQGTLVIPE